NLGQIRTEGADGRFAPAANLLGVAANARVGYRYGITRNELIQGEVVITTGDANGHSDGWFNGVITGNTWGSPGAAFTSHGTYLLMPHINVVNRLTAAVADISNQGFGLTATTLSVSKDLIPNLLTAKLGAAVGFSNIEPARGGPLIGIEANAWLSYQLAVFFTVEAHAAYLRLGNFYDDPRVSGGAERPLDPWTTFVTLKWLMF
ncbi:MAG TPA: hypothetical protein VK447_17990, partial [Myxococcaceae bacterium]|nr:hypothetical protein [Myxococcaceae bacterium]